MRKLLIFMIIVFGLNNPALAKIIETDDSLVIQNELQKLTQEDLVTFDVKGVLYEPEDSVLKLKNKRFVRNFLSRIRQDNLHEADRLEGIILLNYKPVLLDIKIPEIIKDTKERGVKIISLTGGRTGSIGSVNNRQDLRLSRLKSFGIDFTGSFKVTRLLLERNGDGNNRIGRKSEFANDAIFKDGVIFTSRLPKGKILGIFLDKVEFLPKKIVHVDNDISKLGSVQRMCKSRNIEFLGIHYTKQYNNSENDTFDKKVAEKKLKILQTKSLWVSDKIAHCLAHTGFDINYCRSK